MMQRAIFFENGQVYSLQQGMEGQTLESWLFISMHRLQLSTWPKCFFCVLVVEFLFVDRGFLIFSVI